MEDVADKGSELEAAPGNIEVLCEGDDDFKDCVKAECDHTG